MENVIYKVSKASATTISFTMLLTVTVVCPIEPKQLQLCDNDELFGLLLEGTRTQCSVVFADI